MSDGFIQTWYSSQKNFSSLLLNKNVNLKIANLSLDSDADYHSSYGLFIQKVLDLSDSNHLSIKLKLYIADKMHHIDVNGETNSTQFKGSFDYYYTKENLVSKGSTQSRTSYGLGYGIDLEYIFEKNQWYFYLGGFNLASQINYKNVTKMHYDFNSDTIYVGDDGYNHYRSFGVGYYKYNLSFKQKLQAYYKSSINYEFTDNFALGNNLDYYKNMQFNELYTNFKIDDARYKLGYVLESKTLMYGFYFEDVRVHLPFGYEAFWNDFVFEISNQFGMSTKNIHANVKISF